MVETDIITPMALNLKNAEVELLAAEVAELAGETKTEAVRQALAERKGRLARQGGMTKGERMMKFLEEEVWPKIPADVRGKELTKAEREEMLGYGPGGYSE
jgi:antitoxin VapB